MKVKATVTPVDDGFDIRVQTWGCPASTIRFEFGILPNVLIRGEGYRIPANAGGSLSPQRANWNCLTERIRFPSGRVWL